MSEQKAADTKPKPDLTKPVPLAHPLTIGDRVVSEVKFRRAKVKDIEAIENAEKEGGDFAASVMAVACLAELTPEAVREMDFDDFIKVSEIAEAFFPEQVVAAAKAASLARQTGAVPSRK